MSKGRYRPYPEYQESDVEWLGKVPQNWEVGRIKYTVDQSRPITYGIVQAGPNVDNGVPYIRPADMTDEHGVADLEGLLRTSPSIAASYERSRIAKGDIVCSIGPSFGKVMITPSQLNGANLTQGTARIAISDKRDARYFFWVLRSTSSFQQWESCVGGATFRALNLGPLAETAVPLPSLPEQTQIAKFLDHETAKIDRLIEKQEALIRLLKEKRQAVISHAVTKGLNPHAPLKDSGIEWLGQVPAHWSVLKLGHLVKFKGGAGFPDEFQGRTEDEIPFYKVGDLSRTNETFTLTEPNHTVTRSVAKRLRATIFETGTIVFAKVGAALLLKRFSLLPRPSCIDNNMMGAEVDDSVLRGFLLLLLPLLDFDLIVNPGAVPSVNVEQIASIFVALPPSKEQAAITKALRVKNAQLTGLIERANSAITLLQERRTALISAAVTGKIDVRHWQTPVGVSKRETTTAATA